MNPKEKLKEVAELFLPNGCIIADWQYDISGNSNSIFVDIVDSEGLKYSAKITCETIKE